MESPDIGLALEAGNAVVRTADNDHVPFSISLPALHPQGEDVVQVDVGKQRRNHRTLRRIYSPQRIAASKMLLVLTCCLT